ncbi:hypothetical protein NAEGRDRAFT_59952 [Naegleria gruberi]|uniref:Uncharacterized protein n=1 Tax=Naegleria gruberi TaxID=5762 RepID=D2W2Q3_NAEGR|nr:uncharacterized protein NAEGRDRAFT_59952 [Naegleria gruberi]EFC36685.1 hypothetical protein NAEGRDRAFT_59952 [Naegleria gruberi]|eukprot:XP_002669429.1 hypothetical protein NAEGRDRAFT_59952 [Naegleria gruberi strain NEG-M]
MAQSVWDLFSDDEVFESLDTILDNPSTTLEEILDQETLLQEVKSLNPKLISFLTNSKNLRKLIDYISVEEYFEDDILNKKNQPKTASNFFDDDFGSWDDQSSATTENTSSDSIRKQAKQEEEKMKQEYLANLPMKDKLEELENRPELKAIFQHPYVVAEIFGCFIDGINSALISKSEDENYQVYGERFLDLLLIKYLLTRKPYFIPKNRSLSTYWIKAMLVILEKPDKYYIDVVKRMCEIIDEKALPVSLTVDESLTATSEALFENLFIRNIGLCDFDTFFLKFIGMESMIFQTQTQLIQLLSGFSSFSDSYSFSVNSNSSFGNESEEENSEEMKTYKAVQEWTFSKYAMLDRLLNKLESYTTQVFDEDLNIEIEDEQKNIFSLLTQLIEKSLTKRPSYTLPAIQSILSTTNIERLWDIILKCDQTNEVQRSLFILGIEFMKNLLTQIVSAISAISMLTTLDYATLSATDIKVIELGVEALKSLTSSSLLEKLTAILNVAPKQQVIQVLQCGVELKETLGEVRLITIDYIVTIHSQLISLQKSLVNLQYSKNEKEQSVQKVISSIIASLKETSSTAIIVDLSFKFDFNSLLHKQLYNLVAAVCGLSISEGSVVDLKTKLLVQDIQLCKRIVEKCKTIKSADSQSWKGTVGMGYLLDMVELIQNKVASTGATSNESLINTFASLDFWKNFHDVFLKEHNAHKGQLGGSAPIGKSNPNSWHIAGDSNHSHLTGVHVDEEDNY